MPDHAQSRSRPGWGDIEWVGSWQSTESREEQFTWTDELSANCASKRGPIRMICARKCGGFALCKALEGETRVQKSWTSEKTDIARLYREFEEALTRRRTEGGPPQLRWMRFSVGTARLDHAAVVR